LRQESNNLELKLNDVSVQHQAAKAGAAPALRGLNLHVRAGEQLAVIGPSGAGKTTLLQVLACALSVSKGSIYLGQTDPWSIPRKALQQLRGKLFLAPQVAPLPPRQRVVTAVLAGKLPAQTLWQSLRSLFYPTDIAAADKALEQVDLADKLFERVDRLSGGERQRVGLARLIASDATLLLVDEPLSALDPTRASQAMETLTRVANERGATLCCSLHHVEMALTHFPRIIGLRQGEVFFDLPAAQVTPERLKALYGSQLDELTETAPAVDIAIAPSGPAVMHCR
jgi:phosphonate transport system ATP-binding protein